MLYELLKRSVRISFNLLNVILAGNLPPFGCVYVVVEEQDRYLVIELHSGGFVFPGGFMRWREQPVQTVQREVREETGLCIRLGDVIDHYSLPSLDSKRMSTLNIVYYGEVIGGELRGSVEGRPYWLREEELRGKLNSHCEDILNDYLRYRKQRSEASAREQVK